MAFQLNVKLAEVEDDYNNATTALAQREEELTKAQLASHIRQIIKRRRLTQVAAAALMGIDHVRLNTKFQGLDIRLTGVAGEVVRDIMA